MQWYKKPTKLQPLFIYPVVLKMLNNLINEKTEYQFNPLNNITKNDVGLIPLLKLYSTQAGWILLIAPDGRPTKEFLTRNSIDVNKVIVFQKKHCQDVFFTASEAIKHHNCSAIIFWEDALSSEQQNSIYLKGADSEVAIHAIKSDNIEGALQAH